MSWWSPRALSSKARRSCRGSSLPSPPLQKRSPPARGVTALLPAGEMFLAGCSYWLGGKKKCTLNPPESLQLWCRLCLLPMTTYLRSSSPTSGLVMAVPVLHQTRDSCFVIHRGYAEAWADMCDVTLGSGMGRVTVLCFKIYVEI